jgi:hypothetical protein
MSGIVGDNVGRSSGLIKTVTAAGVDTIWDLTKNGDQASITNNSVTAITSWTSVTDTDSAWMVIIIKLLFQQEKVDII